MLKKCEKKFSEQNVSTLCSLIITERPFDLSKKRCINNVMDEMGDAIIFSENGNCDDDELGTVVIHTDVPMKKVFLMS